MYFDKQIYGIHDGYAYYIIVDEKKKEMQYRVWASIEDTMKKEKELLDNKYVFLLYYDNKPVFIKNDSKKMEEIKKMYKDVKR